MPFFPQLQSLAMAQYPFDETHVFRTVLLQTEGGRMWRYADTEARRILWRLTLSSLRDEERLAIDSLFTECCGSLRTFTFIDPADNLLRHSEELLQSAWVRTGGIEVLEGQADPWSTNRANRLTNPTVAEQRLSQVLPVPSAFYYHLSVFMRSAVPSKAGIGIGTTDGGIRKDFALDGTWRRYSVAGTPGGLADEVEARIYLESGASIDITGVQLEAQAGRSRYRPTGGSSGVHAEARFSTDRLTWTTYAENVHGTVIEIVGR
ncbi:MAG: hypothetical protein JNL98_11140 [Bryobacterales bacterium]|nr:hypothetical protein [Bryobacterales bacterium]